ncbi:hypothetical protein VTN00DRAFT_5812 [Thermoascus crustaceus]|uniref:uncharacterized protein n=1 Tax=Thermoascus crustaceus TaxID=5088 RepID=UPI003743B069
MSRLHIPGIPFVEDRASRFKRTGAVFRPIPRRVAFRENPEAAPRRSFLPVPVKPPERPRVSETRSKPRPAARSVVSFPSARSPSAASRLEERRAARLARPRPWLQEGKSSQSLASAAKGPKSTVLPPPPSAPSRSCVLPPTASSRARRAVALIDAFLVKPAISKGVAGGRKDKSVKRIRFGEATVVTVDRWIERKEHVFPAPGRILGQLQGWKVTPLEEPDEDGEMSKYTTYWGSGSSMLSFSHHRPCDRDGCAWNELANIQRGWDSKSPSRFRHWSTADVFKTMSSARFVVRLLLLSIGRRRRLSSSHRRLTEYWWRDAAFSEVSQRSLSPTTIYLLTYLSTGHPVSPWHMALVGFPVNRGCAAGRPKPAPAERQDTRGTPAAMHWWLSPPVRPRPAERQETRPDACTGGAVAPVFWSIPPWIPVLI